jgi:uncharacterized protein YndB with AHSA1/START domain
MHTAGLDSSRGFMLDRDSHTIRFERQFDAPPSRVFAAWTDPEQVACWWDPTGERLVSCDIDLRAGGSFSFVSSGRAAMPFSGIYREIAPPDRLVFEAMGATGRMTLQDVAGGTQMVVEIVCPSNEHFDQFVKMGVQEGTSRTLDNLVAYVSTIRG